MEIDIRTLILILGITHLLQLAIFFQQFKVNKVYNGIGWWLLWSGAEIIGFGCMLLRDIPSILPLIIIVQNNAIILGTIFIYIGLMRFLGKRENIKLIITVFALFEAGLLFFLLIHNDFHIRSVLINLTIAFVSFITAVSLYKNKLKAINFSANFNVIVFILHGCYFIYRSVILLQRDEITDIFSPTLFNVLPYIDALIVSILWTYGFIVMLNQRLNSEMKEAKEEVELIFDTSPDAAIITRIDDGYILNVNHGYTLISGYTRKESLGNSSVSMNLWKNQEDRTKIITILKNKGYCDNFEAIFCRKDGTEIIGLMSAKIIDIKNQQYILSIIRNISERKLTEKALKESEAKYRLISENADDWIYLVKPDGTLSYTSPSTLKITGYSVEEIISNVPLAEEIVHPEDKEKVKCHFSSVNEENKGEEIEFRIITKTGDIKWLHHQCSSLYTSEGIYAGRKVINRDITKRKLAEEAANKSRKELDRLFEVSPDMICFIGFDGTFKRLNPAWEKTLGFMMDKMLFKPFIDFVHPDDVEITNTEAEKLSKGQRTINFENRYRCIDNSFRWLSWSVIPDTEEKLFYGVARDITDKKKYEKKLNESEERFQLAMKASNDGLFDWNLETNDIYYSPGWKRMLGYEDHELPNDFSVWENTTEPEDVKKSWELQQQLISKLIDRFVMEFKMKHKKGHWVHILSRAEAIFNDKGKAVRIVGTHTDITEHKIAEDEIKKLNETLEQKVNIRTTQLEAAYAEMEAFSYSVSHDLRSPLRAIDGFSKIILEKPDIFDTETLRLLYKISQNAEKMNTLIEDLLTFAKVGKANISAIPVKMKELVRSLLTEFKQELRKQNLSVNTIELPDIIGDKTLLNQVWSNLIKNAIKFTSKTDNPEIEIGSYIEAKEIVFYIKDNGVGFDMKYVDKLFRVFERLHTSEEFEGTGIGLAIVKKAVTMHGGRVWAESKEGEGACFYFAIPVVG